MTGFCDGSGISWTIQKQSSPRCRQITTPTPHHTIFTGQMLFLTPNQQCQSTEGNFCTSKLKSKQQKQKKVIARQVSVISGDTLTQYTTGFTFSINNKTGPKTKTKVFFPETKITQSSDKFSAKNEHKRNYSE